jgi:kumamolisin
MAGAVFVGLGVTAPGETGAESESPSIRTVQRSGNFVTLANYVLPDPLGREGAVLQRTEAQTQPMIVTVVLKRTDERGFEQYVRDVGNPNSPNFRRFLSSSAITEKFGPSIEAYNAVRRALAERGLEIVEGSTNRLTLTARNKRDQVEQAFGVKIRDYQRAQASFFRNTGDPSLPQTIAPYVQAIVGLSDLARPIPLLRPSSDSSAPDPPTPMSIAHAYHFDTVGANGTGQKIGLVEFHTFNPTDIEKWLELERLPNTLREQLSVVNFAVDHPRIGTSDEMDKRGEAEVLLDIEVVLGMAPGAKVVVLNAPPRAPLVGVLNAVISAGVNIISISWGTCEDMHQPDHLKAIDAVLMEADAQGISVFAATGDEGDACKDSDGDRHPQVALVPANSPHVTAVGGTTLDVRSDGSLHNEYVSERWWNSRGGFGVTSKFAAWYQSPFTRNQTRSLPDVVANADPDRGIEICQEDNGGCPSSTRGGGTSMAAPEWAAGIALLNEKCGGALGLVNEFLYNHAREGGFGLHGPSTMSGPGNDFGHVGLGSFALKDLGAAACVAKARSPWAAPISQQSRRSRFLGFGAGWSIVNGPVF